MWTFQGELPVGSLWIVQREGTYYETSLGPSNCSGRISTFFWTYNCCCLVAHSCPTLCNPMDCSLPVYSAHGISEARILEWIAISFARGSSWLRDQNHIFCLAGGFFTTWEAQDIHKSPKIKNRCHYTKRKVRKNQSSNCQHLLDYRESKGIPEKHLPLFHQLH